MILEEIIDLRNISNDYYACELSKAKDSNDLIVDLGNTKIVFKSCLIFKCGYPNDEIYCSFDYASEIVMYSLLEVKNSVWIESLCNLNHIHSRHSDALFEKDRHFIIFYKDEVFECISTSFEIVNI